MARFGINTGSTANDGQGDTLRAAMGKINSNFLEIYTTLGDTNNVISYASTAGISTLAQNLTGSPRINVSGILNTGITTTEHLEVRNIKSTGIVTAVQFVGDGSQLSNVTATNPGVEILDDNVRRGVAKEINFGANIISSGPDGLGRVTISVASGSESTNYANSSGVSTYATSAGIASYAQVSGIASNLSGTPNVNLGVVTATSFRGDGSLLTGVTAQGTGISIEDENITIGVAQTINFGNNLTVGPLLAGKLTIDASGIATGLSGSPNITVGNINAGIVTATNFIGDGSGLTGVVVAAAGTWTSNSAGIHTVKNVGIGSTLPSSKLTVAGDALVSGITTVVTSNGKVTIGSASTTLLVEGDARITGILTIGNSSITIDSINNTIAVGSGVTINGNSGVITATSFVGSGSNLTGIITAQDITNSLVGYATTGYVQNYVTNIAGFATVGFVTSLVAISTFSKDYYDLKNLPFIPTLLTDFNDVDVPNPTPGQVLKWNGNQWVGSSDLVGAGGTGGTGIGLSDISVTQYPVGISSLSYNSSTGIFYYTPPNLTGYATTASLNSAVANSSNWDSAYGWGNHALVGYTTTGYVAGAISTVTSALSGFTTVGQVESIIAGYGYVDSTYVLYQIGIKTFTGAATTITVPNISNWNTAYEWGNHATQGYLTSYSESDTLSSVLSRNNSSIYGISLTGPTGILSATGVNVSGAVTATSFKVSGGTSSQFLKADGSFDTNTYLSNVNITAGANITVLETSEGNFIITSTAAGGGGSSQWTTVASGIITTSNVGIATTVATSALTVVGDGKFTGVVTATRFESTSAGTPTIDSPNNLNINASTVAISTDTTVGREFRVAGITTVNAGGVRVAGVVTATKFDINGTTTTITSGGISVSGVSTLGFATATQLFVSGVTTATSFSGSGSNLTGIVTYIEAGAGISVDQNTGKVIITNTGGGGGGSVGLTIRDENNLVGTAGSITTLNFTGNVVATAAGSASTITIPLQTYVESAGIATYSDNAGIATYASTAGIATYATTAGIATYATTAGIATYATTSGIATYATTAGIATYATYADNAGIATYATTAGIVTYATSSGISTYATTAGIATYATTAGISTYATTAGIATYTSEWILGAIGNSDYTFTGPGFTGAESDPVLYLVRGQQYKFTNTMGIHPFRIQSTVNGSVGTQYNDGIVNNDVSNGTLTWNVQFDTPNILYYQCTVTGHGSMGGKIYIIDAGVGPDISINTTGIITATSFTGNLTGTATTATYADAAGIATNAQGLTGTPNITVGVITASSFSGSGVNLTGVVTSIVAGTNVTISGSTGQVTINATGGGGGGSSQWVTTNAGIHTLSNVGIGTTNPTSALTVKGNTSLETLNVSGVSTSTSFRTNSTVGDGTDVGFAIKYYITSNGASAYRFAGPGIVNTVDNPTIYLHRGFTYIFENSTGGSHPFAIRYSSGGTGYGSTYLSGSQSGTQVFTIPFDAPSSLVYQCTIHSGMLGTLTIVA